MLVPSPIPLMRCDAQHPASQLNRGWRRGTLTRVIPGVYADAKTWAALPPWDQQLAKVHAVIRTHRDTTVCGISAAALYGVAIGGANRDVHLFDRHATSRHTGAVRMHTAADFREIHQHNGILVTSIPDTIVDIARSATPAEGLAYANALLRLDRSITTEQLIAINETRISTRNRRHARWAISRATGVPESVLESLSLAVIEMSGFEMPEAQREFHFEGETDRGDFFWPSVGVLGEADGAMKYRSDAAEVILAEKRREIRLRRNLDGLIRWGWREARNPSLLTPILSRARIPRPHAADSALLATIAHFAQ